MRTKLLVLVGLGCHAFVALSLPRSALAKPRPTPADTPSETASARAARLADETGSRRDTSLRAPSLDGASVASGNATERAPTDADAAQRPAGPLSGALEELVGRQMERNAAVFDRCVGDAKKRDPSLHGELELAVSVLAKKASARVSSPNVDPVLATCLTTSAKTLRVSLPDLSFPWKLQLGAAQAVTQR